MKFRIHTSDEWVDQFKSKPYQMQDPEKAQIIFLSSDANYSQQISRHLFFKYILEYHKNGIAFWEKHNCHHPFILPNYPKEFDKRKDGVPFHRNFRKLGLQWKSHAEHISFLEILDVPTIGNKSENKEMFFDLLCRDHLEYIDKLVQCGGRKLFIIAKGVLDDIADIKKSYANFFGWYTPPPQGERFLKEINGNKIKEYYHFSASQIHAQIPEIRAEIDNWLNNN